MGVNFPADCEALIRTIESDVYHRPESVLQPLRQLLRHCSGDEQLAYAYEHLGFAYLRLGEHRMSKVFYEQALSLQPDNVYVLANLAHAVYELGETHKAVQFGRHALRLKDELVGQVSAGSIGRPHGGTKNLVSFSLYGNKARYCETAILNCSSAIKHLPGFICRFHVDESVPANVLQRLRDHGAEVVFLRGPSASIPKTFWRFLAIDDPEANFVLVRDVDSIIDAREAYCVNEWIESQKPFHIIRDDCCHTELILAGLFAARSGTIPAIRQKIETFLASKENHPIGRYSDQLFLRKIVWPIARNCAVTHDRIYKYGTDVRESPGQLAGPANQFIGANYSNYGLQITTPDAFAEDAIYLFRILDALGNTVCEYPMDFVNRQQLQILLPQPYGKHIESGAWRYELLGCR